MFYINYLYEFIVYVGDVFQAEDRVRRIGQLSSVVYSLWLVGYPIDDKLDKLLQSKDKSSQIVLNNSVIQNTGKKQWFTGSHNTSNITNYFQQQQQHNNNNNNNNNINDNTCINWNVKECEEELTTTSNNIMNELLKSIC